MSWLVDHAYLLDASDAVLFAWWTKQTEDIMVRRHHLEPAVIDRAHALQRAADRFVGMSQLGQDRTPRQAGNLSHLGHQVAPPISAEQSSPQSITDLPPIITAQEAAKLLGVSRKKIDRIKGQLGPLREKPLLLTRDVVIAYKIARDTRSSAA
jgi:hypothetical protein